MEDVIYNILWIDDEHETLSGTKGRAKRNGIQLIPFKSLNAGISELERNYPFYDGVLLDAKFFENEEDIQGSEDTENVHRAKEQLLQLKKEFEIFVLTGQAEAYEDRTFNKAFKKVYKKGHEEDIMCLFEDIKAAAANQQDTQLRQAYKRVFDVCNEKYIGELAAQDILNLLKANDETNIDNHFNAIRIIVEDIFVAFTKFKLLPSEFTSSCVSLNEASKFMAGKSPDGTFFIEKGYQHQEGTHLPKQITFYLRNILSVTQAGSHRSEIDLFVKTIKTSFLFKSVFYQLLDIIIWFKMYIDTKPQTENWVKIVEVDNLEQKEDSITGKVININNEKGFAFLQQSTGGKNIFIPPHLVNDYSLVADQKIIIEIEEYTDNRTGDIKVRASKILELLK